MRRTSRTARGREQERGRDQARGRRTLLASLFLALLLAAIASGAAVTAAPAGAQAKPGRPSATSPSGEITSVKPLFSWTRAARAARYEVRVYRAGKLLVARTGLTRRSWRCGVRLEKNAPFSWQVRARNSAGAGPWSVSRRFKVALAIGDSYGGGIVAHILKAGDPGYVAGRTHGLIAAPADLTPADPWGVSWSNFTDSLVGPTAQGTALGTGEANTAAIVAQTIDTQTCIGGAAHQCENLIVGGYDDWYLPSKDELHKVYLLYMRYAVAGQSGGFNPSGYYQSYWSSSEAPANDFGFVLAWYEYFDNDPAPGADLQNTHVKTKEFSVRAVRSF